jgi:hypothetical protein
LKVNGELWTGEYRNPTGAEKRSGSSKIIPGRRPSRNPRSSDNKTTLSGNKPTTNADPNAGKVKKTISASNVKQMVAEEIAAGRKIYEFDENGNAILVTQNETLKKLLANNTTFRESVISFCKNVNENGILLKTEAGKSLLEAGNKEIFNDYRQ